MPKQNLKCKFANFAIKNAIYANIFTLKNGNDKRLDGRMENTPQYVFVFTLNKHKGKLKERFTEGYKDVSNLQNFHIFNRAYSFQRLKKTNAQRAI